ncbi:hypothetical protein [Eisenbergiella sp.]|uniref:hypothetical protein n=1 Tax=Eisenbergiella sp. TaxID=1924109 RepID=UPI003FA4C5F2
MVNLFTVNLFTIVIIDVSGHIVNCFLSSKQKDPARHFSKSFLFNYCYVKIGERGYRLR